MVDLVLKNTQATLEVTFTSAADGTVTVTTTKGDGSNGPGGNATRDGATSRYTFVLAPQAEVESFVVKWAGVWGGVAQSVETRVDVVGAQLFALSEARAFDNRALQSTSLFPDAALRVARASVTDFFEECCNVSFVPRYARETIDGNGDTRLRLSKRRVRKLLSVSIDGVALSAPDLAALKLYDWGRLVREGGWSEGARNVAVSYEHGWASVPAAIRRAALVLSRHELVVSDHSDRMIAVSNELGTVRMSVPGRDYPTGIPVVDAALARYDEHELFA